MSRLLCVEVDPELKDKVKLKATKEGKTLVEIVNKALEDFLNVKEKNPNNAGASKPR